MHEPVLPLTQTVPAAVAAIQAAQTIVLACHVNPDGDALGSMIGLTLALQSLDKSPVPLSQDGVPEIYQFLPGRELVGQSTEAPEFDLAIVLDSGDFPRVGERVQPLVSRAARIIDIDHHTPSGAFGAIRVLNPRAASTSEIVYTLIQSLGVTITPQIATCLFTGIITDTGSFRFQNVTPNTFQIAAALLEAGAPPAYISENVFENRTFAATRLLGQALSSLRQTLDGRIVWAQITVQDFARLGAADEDTEGVVNYVRSVRGADVGILFREMGRGEGGDVPAIRVSLRSRETINVAEIAQQFGGGGHRMASGCTLNMPLADAEHAVLAALSSVLPAANP